MNKWGEPMEQEKLYITDLIDVQELQDIQDAFCEMTGIAAGICDADGVAVTRDFISTDFCMNFNKKSPIGRFRCEQCDKRGGELALENGKCVTYHCHTGLVDFAAPIMANGQMIGCFIGGQIRTEELDEKRLRMIANEIGVDEDAYIEAAREIQLVTQEKLDRSTKFLYKISNTLSNMAYNRYQVLQANKEIEKAAQMKADFLANMSHEIRTPMNAVLGMAEMALREELPEAARECVGQIISSGRTLLTIINDILDFSKIESGKMDIEEMEYEPMSIINDVANIIMTRIGDKDVELILDIAPDLPYKLIGDSNRLKQIMINLSNNAVKFTPKGQVVLKVGFETLINGEILLQVSVIDTGIGIKSEDLKKLFVSFQQLDSKRNRNIEGTGLGLTISKRLLELMNGEIWVESEYGKGSEFSFALPQKVLDKRESVMVRERETIVAAGLMGNSFLKKHIGKDMEQLKVSYMPLESPAELEEALNDGATFFFFGQDSFTEEVECFVKEHPDITAVVMIDYRNALKYDINNLLVVKKPVYVMNIAAIFNHEEIHMGYNNFAHDAFEFTAPEAEVLIVDDNAINLTVAEGLLEPLKMNIETASSGKEAVEMISSKMYDLIFMDHMMPELDGVETTRIIRRFYKEYDDVPIIALTANAVNGIKEKFLQEGMNDFVAKPIEIRNIVSKLRRWLPAHKICRIENNEDELSGDFDQTKNWFAQGSDTSGGEEEKIEIEGLDTKLAFRLLGTQKLFWSVLKDYYRVIDKKSKLIKQLEQDGDISRYTIEVHALKSASKQIGAVELSDMALALEVAGNDGDEKMIHEHTDEMLELYRSYLDVLKPYFPEEKKKEKKKQQMNQELMDVFFENMRTAIDELDMDNMEQIIGSMEEYQLDERQEQYLQKMKEAVEEFDVDTCEEIMEKWEKG